MYSFIMNFDSISNESRVAVAVSVTNVEGWIKNSKTLRRLAVCHMTGKISGGRLPKNVPPIWCSS